MKTSQIIITGIIFMTLTSCLSTHYNITTQIDRNGSGRREFNTITSNVDSITKHFPYDLSYGWEISQTDTVVEKQYSLDKNSFENKKNVKIRKRFNSLNDLSVGLHSNIAFPIAKESIKKRFRWFYTYYEFTAIYPEIADKGLVPIENYLNESEQKFYFQGNISAYKGMNGLEWKEMLDDIETRFLKWYNRSTYEECFDVIMRYAELEYRLKLPTIKDSLYSILERQNNVQESMEDVCAELDKYFSTDIFKSLYRENKQEMNSLAEERIKKIEHIMEYNIHYELIMPGEIITANTDLQNDDVLKWNVNMFWFLADDYTLTAESRTINLWAFAITLLLIIFSVYCFVRK